MAWTVTSSTVINLPNGAKVYEGYFDALCANLDNIMGSTSTGFPTSVTALGNRTVAGEFVQHGTGTVTSTGDALSLTQQHNLAVTYPVAYVSAPVVLANETAGGFPCAAYSITNTGFSLAVWDAATTAISRNVQYIALGK